MFAPPKRKMQQTPRKRHSFARRSVDFARSPKSPAPSNICVLLRVRPAMNKELDTCFRDVVEVLDDTLVIFDPKEEQDPFFVHGKRQAHRDITKPTNKNLQFGFDHVYGPEASTNNMYQKSIKNLIESLLNGYNCSVFAYGATGSGKTYTMLGSSEEPGITPLLMQELYTTLNKLENTDVDVMVSYLEIYNEMVRDLMVEKKRVLQLREDGANVLVSDLTWHRPSTADHLMTMLQRGNERRTQHPTDANAESSRSHAVFQVMVKMKRRSVLSRSGMLRCSKLSMIDLAGSERAAATTNNADRFLEGANINKSLLALGNCINSLADGLKHVPFRNSKLTRLLKGSLGGNCRTVMIANVSPCSSNYEDTYNTLKYATRAKKIKNRARKNQVSMGMTPADFARCMEQKQAEIEALKAEKSQHMDEICNLREALVAAGLHIPASPSLEKPPVPSPMSVSELSLEEVQRLMEILLDARKKLAAATDTHTIIKANLEKMQARNTDKKAKLQRARSLYPDDMKYETEEMVDKRIAAPRSSLEQQLVAAQREVQRRSKRVTQAEDELLVLAAQLGSAVSRLLQIVNELTAYHAQPDFVECKVEKEHYKDLLKLKAMDQESYQKAFCALAEMYNKAFFMLKGLKYCPPDMEQNFEKLRSFVRGHYSVSWRDQQQGTMQGNGDSEQSLEIVTPDLQDSVTGTPRSVLSSPRQATPFSQHPSFPQHK